MKAEYIALPHSMREAIPMMTLLRELRSVLPETKSETKIHYTKFEENNGCAYLVRCLKMFPRTKHIALKCHHFRLKVKQGLVTVERIDTSDQISDALTKALVKV